MLEHALDLLFIFWGYFIVIGLWAITLLAVLYVIVVIICFVSDQVDEYKRLKMEDERDDKI